MRKTKSLGFLPVCCSPQVPPSHGQGSEVIAKPGPGPGQVPSEGAAPEIEN